VSITIGARQWEISLDDAQAAVAGYAFAVQKFGKEHTPKWGYRTFDCIPASPGAEFSHLDILVAAGLNAQLDVDAINALRLATRRAQPYLAAAAERERAFTELSLAELADEPPPGSTGWLLAQAYRQMETTPHVGLARAHEVLHHKQPMLVPLLDNLTAGIYQDTKGHRLRSDWNLWQHVRAEIDGNKGEFEALRQWFAAQAAARGDAPLGLLRLHDILVWLSADKRQWDDALTAGKAL
jgi:Family of unknown function (DUF6308)